MDMKTPAQAASTRLYCEIILHSVIFLLYPNLFLSATAASPLHYYMVYSCSTTTRCCWWLCLACAHKRGRLRTEGSSHSFPALAPVAVAEVEFPIDR